MSGKVGFSIKRFFKSKDNKFVKGILPSPGFTFQCQNLHYIVFQKQAKCSRQKTRKQKNHQITEVTWIHPGTGVETEIQYTYYNNTDVLEIEGRIFNRGKKTLKNVNGPFSLCLGIDNTGMGTPQMTTVYGGASTNGNFPPPSYLVKESDGLYSILGGREGGRSTETEMPYAIITDPEETSGFFYTLEWPCRWILCSGETIENSRKIIKILMHVAYTGFDLKPGQSIYLPKANIGFFKGNSIAGSNALRKHIVENIRRPIKGASILPPVFYNHYYGFGDDIKTFNEKILKKEAEAYAELGMEYFVVDAGWFKNGFRNGIGNWEIEEDKVFPNGMAAFADYVRSLGMKFGSWLEPEFAMKDSDWVKRHPDWFYYADNKHDYFYGRKNYTDCLLKLDNKKVRKQVADFFERWVNKYGIEWLRWDFNNAPAQFWEANETHDQWGRIQLEYGEGLFALQDEFMTRCPQVHLEACAGGGHRMDMGTLRRAHSVWINDNSITYNAIRRFQAGVNRVQPGNYGTSAFLWATHEHQREKSISWLKRNGYPPTVMRSRMAGSLCFAEQSHLYTPKIKEYLKKEITNYKKQRHLLMKDYYPLFNPQQLADYDGWQFHDPDTGEGFFQIFRCQSPDSKVEVELPGLNKGTTYQLKDVDTGRQRQVNGGKKLRIEIPEKDGVKWYQYCSKE